MAVFSSEIGGDNRKTREADVWEGLRLQKVNIEPVRYRLIELDTQRDKRPDAAIEISFGGHRAQFVLEIKSTSTPKTIEAAALQSIAFSTPEMPPMVAVPYLSDEAMNRLASEGVSGFDLCGNVVIVRGGLYIWNGGHPNRFPETRPIKNIYRGRGSIFARCFLLKNDFASLAELREFALARLSPERLLKQSNINPSEETRLSASTASKVLATLSEDLIVQRSETGIQLTDSAELVQKLKTNFVPLKQLPIQGRTSLSNAECWERICAHVKSSAQNVAATGLGSAAHYGAMGTESRLSVRANQPSQVMDLLEVAPTRAFPNVEILLDEDEPAFFDCRLEGGAIWASPIQTLLELSTSGPRERDSASRFEEKLLKSGGSL